MARPEQASIHNYLLAALSAEDFGLLQPDLEPVTLGLREHVFRAGKPISHVLFPERGILSIVADIEDGRFEVGMAGWEGLAGIPAVLGVGHTPHDAIVQGAGDGWRIAAEKLQAAMDASATL
jgi:CRP-like cAMP-binding protein